MEKIVKILKKIKIRNIIILILLLIFNTYAWFLYATKVSSGLSAHVSSWNVEFTTGEGEIVTNIVIEVEKIFPGMENYEKNIVVNNKGEIKAILEYEIQTLKIMDETYVIGEDITQEELKNKLENEYPFKINITMDETQLNNGSGPGNFNIKIEWPFESGNDELDTLWGNKAYEYYSANPGEKSIEMQIKLIAKQIES